MNRRVVMLLSNPFRPDPRVRKEALSLSAAGYQVTVLCWDREREFPPFEQLEGVLVRRLRIRSRYSLGSRQIYRLAIFWLRALQELAVLRPDILHCHDLDTLPPALCYCYLNSIPCVYDAHECYPEQIRHQVNRIIYLALLWLERYLSRAASEVITVGQRLAGRFNSFGCKVTIVGNFPFREDSDIINGSVSKIGLNIDPEHFVVSYIGGFTSARAILPLIRATGYLERATVLLGGDGPQRSAVESEVLSYPSVRYLGWVPHQKIMEYLSISDAVYYGLEGSDGNSYYSCPNMLFSAMASGKPVITTEEGEIADIVRAERCGIVIKRAQPDLIALAIEQLNCLSLRLELGRNGREAVERKFNWSMAERSLLEVYEAWR